MSTKRALLALLILCLQNHQARCYIRSSHDITRTYVSPPIVKSKAVEPKTEGDSLLSQFDVEEHKAMMMNAISHDSPAAAASLPLSCATSIASLSPTSTGTLNPLEAWCLSHLDQWYCKSQAIKCPFLRRRLGDALDNVETIMKNTVIRPECHELMGPPQAWRPAGLNKKVNQIKYKGLDLESLRQYVLQDWKADTGKGYYVTGKLTTAIYRDDCLFLGPDPDMPIKGLRKYVGVAAHLFDVEQSRATLKSLDIVDNTLVARWQLRGILKLPWRPHLPTFSGATTYHFDEEGLVEKHEESWDMTVAHAFCHTLFPDLAKHIWKEEEELMMKEEQKLIQQGETSA